MPTEETEGQAALRQLDRVLASPGFARNERLSRFLRFVVERHLEGRDAELKESLLAIGVFGRPPDYDPKQDPIVRKEAGRLRALLSEYYLSEGKNDSTVIELPKGGYVPVLRRAVIAEPEGLTQARPPAPRRIWMVASLVALVVLGGRWRGGVCGPKTRRFRSRFYR